MPIESIPPRGQSRSLSRLNGWFLPVHASNCIQNILILVYRWCGLLFTEVKISWTQVLYRAKSAIATFSERLNNAPLLFQRFNLSAVH